MACSEVILFDGSLTWSNLFILSPIPFKVSNQISLHWLWSWGCLISEVFIEPMAISVVLRKGKSREHIQDRTLELVKTLPGFPALREQNMSQSLSPGILP